MYVSPVSKKICFQSRFLDQLLSSRTQSIISCIYSLKLFQNVDHLFLLSISQMMALIRSLVIPTIWENCARCLFKFDSGYFFPCSSEIFLKIRTKVINHPSGNGTNVIYQHSWNQFYTAIFISTYLPPQSPAD